MSPSSRVMTININEADFTQCCWMGPTMAETGQQWGGRALL